MSKFHGNLRSSASGINHIGAIGHADGSLVQESAVPFGTLHVNSGVFATDNGQIFLRGKADQTGLELSIDGGATFTNIGSSGAIEVPGSGLVGVNGVDATWVGSDIVTNVGGLSGLVQQLANSGITGVNGAEISQVNGDWVVDTASVSGMSLIDRGFLNAASNLQRNSYYGLNATNVVTQIYGLPKADGFGGLVLIRPSGTEDITVAVDPLDSINNGGVSETINGDATLWLAIEQDEFNWSLNRISQDNSSERVITEVNSFNIDGMAIGARILFNGGAANQVGTVDADTATTVANEAGFVTIHNDSSTNVPITFTAGVSLTGGLTGDLTLQVDEYAKIYYSADGLSAHAVRISPNHIDRVTPGIGGTLIKNSFYNVDATGISFFFIPKADGDGGSILVQASGTNNISLTPATGDAVNGVAGQTATLNGDRGLWLLTEQDGTSWDVAQIAGGSVEVNLPGSGLTDTGHGVSHNWVGSNVEIDSASLSGLVQQLANSGIVGVNGVDVSQVDGDWTVDAAALSGILLDNQNGSGIRHLGESIDGIVQPVLRAHMTSGVYHDGQGASGIIRFRNNVLEGSIDGGLTFTPFGSDNLGNHTATQDLSMGGFVLDRVGEQIFTSAAGFNVDGTYVGSRAIYNGSATVIVQVLPDTVTTGGSAAGKVFVSNQTTNVNSVITFTAFGTLTGGISGDTVLAQNEDAIIFYSVDGLSAHVVKITNDTILPGSGLTNTGHGVSHTWNGSDIEIDSASLSGLVQQLANSGIAGVNGIDVTQVNSDWIIDAASVSGLINHQNIIDNTASFAINGENAGDRVRFTGFLQNQTITVEADVTTQDSDQGATVVVANESTGNRPVIFLADAGLTNGLTGDLTLNPGEYATVYYAVDGLSARVVRDSSYQTPRGIITSDPDPALKNSFYVLDVSAADQGFTLPTADGNGGTIMLQVSGINNVNTGPTAGDTLNNNTGSQTLSGDGSLWLFIEQDNTSWHVSQISPEENADIALPGSGLVGNNGVALTWVGDDIVADAAGLSGLVVQLATSGIEGVNGIDVFQLNDDWVIDGVALSGQTQPGSGLTDTGHGVSHTWAGSDIQVDSASLSGFIQQLANSGIIGVNGADAEQVAGDWIVDLAPLSGLIESASGIQWNINNIGEQLTVLSRDDITLRAGDADGLGLGGQLDLQAFAGSGTLNYQFGPNEGWYSNGFPLPHSGQICQMILEKTTSPFTELVSEVTSVTITHNFASSGVLVQVYDNNTGLLSSPDTIRITGLNTVDLTFNSPFTGQVVVLG